MACARGWSVDADPTACGKQCCPWGSSGARTIQTDHHARSMLAPRPRGCGCLVKTNWLEGGPAPANARRAFRLFHSPSQRSIRSLKCLRQNGSRFFEKLELGLGVLRKRRSPNSLFRCTIRSAKPASDTSGIQEPGQGGFLGLDRTGPDGPRPSPLPVGPLEGPGCCPIGPNQFDALEEALF